MALGSRLRWAAADHFLALRRLPSSSSAPTAVVFFQITSLELSTSAPAASKIQLGNPDEALVDQLDSGALGCYIDPQVTKLLQTGLERSLVPDVSAFLGIGELMFQLSRLDASVLTIFVLSRLLANQHGTIAAGRPNTSFATVRIRRGLTTTRSE